MRSHTEPSQRVTRRRRHGRTAARSTRRQASMHERPTRSLRRPMTPALTLLEALAVSLAAEGVEIRGALAHAPRAVTLRLVAEATPAAEGGELVVGRFEIPTTTNHGEPFPHGVLLPLLHDLYVSMGGATFLETVGLWRADDGAFCLDLSLAVEVWTRSPTRLEAFVRRVASELDQEVIALRLTRPDFLWVTPMEGGES